MIYLYFRTLIACGGTEMKKQKCDRNKKPQKLSEKDTLNFRSIGVKLLNKMSDETIAKYKKSQKELEKLEIKRKEAAAKKLLELEKKIKHKPKTEPEAKLKQPVNPSRISYLTRSPSWMNFAHFLSNKNSNDKNPNITLVKGNDQEYLNQNFNNQYHLKMIPIPNEHIRIGHKLPIQPRTVNKPYNFKSTGNSWRGMKQSTHDCELSHDNSNQLQSGVKNHNITSQGEISKELDKNINDDYGNNKSKNVVSCLKDGTDRGDKSDIKIQFDEVILSQDGSSKASRLVDYSILAKNVRNGCIHMDEVAFLGNKMIYKKKDLSFTSSLNAKKTSVEDLISSVENVRKIWSTTATREIGLYPLNSNVIGECYNAPIESLNLELHLSITPYECVQHVVALAEKYYETADYEDISTIYSPVVISFNKTNQIAIEEKNGKHVWDLARHKSSKFF